jgi:hypothetical protein
MSGINTDKVVKYILICVLVGILLTFIGLPLLVRITGPSARGTGSYKYAKIWKDKLSTCNSLDDVHQQFNCGRWQANQNGSYTYIKDPNTFQEGNTWALLYDFPNGDWIAMAYASSHGAWGGGTVVTRDNTGNIRVFFGHVCGRPVSRGESLEEVYASFDGSDWKEVSLEE